MTKDEVEISVDVADTGIHLSKRETQLRHEPSLVATIEVGPVFGHCDDRVTSRRHQPELGDE